MDLKWALSKTLPTQKAHGPHIWEDNYIAEDL